MTQEQIQLLKNLKELLDKGVLNQEEFDNEKAKVLSGVDPISDRTVSPEGLRREGNETPAITQDNHIARQSTNGLTPPSMPIKCNFELARDEFVLSKVKCTIGAYPSVNSFLYLTNHRIVVKSIPILLHPLGFILNFNSLYGSTKVDMPLSSVVSVEKKSLKCKISDGHKSFVVFKILAMSSGFDDAIDKMVALIKHQFGRDVLK